MTLRKKLLRYFFMFQLLLLIPGWLLIVATFFSGEDSLHDSFMHHEVHQFLEHYKEDPNALQPQGYTFLSFIGDDEAPKKYLPLIRGLTPGLHELKLEGRIGFDDEEEVRVMVKKVSADLPYFYFISRIPDSNGEVFLLKGLLLSTVVFFLFVSVFGFLMALAFSKKISRPLERIAEKIHQSHEADLVVDSSSVDYGTEINILTSALDEKNKRIAKFIRRERHVMRNISHELRTPITILKSSLNLIMFNSSNGGEYMVKSHMMAKMERASNDLESMVEAFLWLGREENTHVSNKTNCAVCIKKAISDHRYLLDDKAVELDLNFESDVTIHCKESIFYIVVANLIRNAFNFTQKGAITITLMNNIFAVSDSGRGIDQAVADQIRQSGFKGEESTGFGYGLDIVEHVCEQMGWCLNIKGNHNDQGTLALVSFS